MIGFVQPDRLDPRRVLSALQRRARTLSQRMGRDRFCPVCEKWSRRFAPNGETEAERMCPHCESLERHRMLWRFLERCTDLMSRPPELVLHVAPEGCFSSQLRSKLGTRYVTIDLHSPHVMMRVDVTSMPFADNSVDAIICSHVLEHVRDDRGALAEMRRVLRSSGWAAIMVPIMYPAETDEDPAVTDPDEQTRRFGYPGHLRGYGEQDFLARLAAAKLDPKVVRYKELFSPLELQQSIINEDAGDVFVCTPS